jgi:DNA transformation protein
MSASEEFVEYVLDLLRPIDGIQTSRMFGGVLLKVDGRQLGVLFEDIAYFKVMNLDLQDKFKKEGSKQFEYTRKDKKSPVIIKNWWSVPSSAMDNSDEIVGLAEDVLNQKELK